LAIVYFTDILVSPFAVDAFSFLLPADAFFISFLILPGLRHFPSFDQYSAEDIVDILIAVNGLAISPARY